jgi:hypothetical protein
MLIKLIPNTQLAESFLNISPATEHIPKWYLDSPSRMPVSGKELAIMSPTNLTGSYPRCTPFLDALITGYTVFLTADVEVVHDFEEPKVKILSRSANREIISQHPKSQIIGFVTPEGYDSTPFKWMNDYTFETPKGYSSLFTHPFNRYDLPFLTISGVVDTDKFPLNVNFPFFIKNDFQGIIKAGTPICQILPFKREDWVTEVSKFDLHTTMTNVEKLASKIVRSYKSQFWTKKSYAEKKTND